MGIRFSADEVLSIAERIELNGVHFYETAASKLASTAATPSTSAGGPELANAQKLLLELAKWEMTHQQTFAAMRQNLPASQKDTEVFDPDNEIALYLQSFADTHVFNPREDPVGRLGEHPSYRDILLTAIGLEKDSIVFYLMMKAFVPENLGQSKVEAILKEETTHVVILNRELVQAP
jgi:rubrerythrin